MRKLAAAFVLGLVLVVGAGTAPAPAQNGVATFTFTNNAAHTIFIKIYGPGRRWVWPGPNRHFVLDDRTPRDARIACRVGEKVCYGGSYTANDRPRYWGVGYTGTRGCQGCCLTCGTASQNVSYHWSLTE